MNTIKTILLKLPEYLLIVSVLFYWISASVIFNPIAIILSAILVIQLVIKNRTLGILIPIVLILVCCFMLLALFSEFNEFPTFNNDAKELLFVGLSFFIGTILISGLMLYKYSNFKLSN
ncbi:hypothetical protein [Winogradskyella sp. UBA3174]|uniref:hypothetical protein n=1 Tax=Winogradskyella sp. UBA3174 TaxID=1947785 RepID=UPI0025F017F0|nr:hypothetical protein [Winogradskyella sp. UBA3174]